MNHFGTTSMNDCVLKSGGSRVSGLQMSFNKAEVESSMKRSWGMIVSTPCHLTLFHSSLILSIASFFDHARDLLFMINHFQDQITQPIIGLGHSMGGMQM